MKQPFDPDEMAVILDRMVESGWIRQWGTHGEKYALQWTAKGYERCALAERNCRGYERGGRGFSMLITFCRLHGPTA